MSTNRRSSKTQVTEGKAIVVLKSLSRVWPDSLWIFANGSGLHVMRLNEKGERAMNEYGSVDQNYCVVTIDIPNDGGDF